MKIFSIVAAALLSASALSAEMYDCEVRVRNGYSTARLTSVSKSADPRVQYEFGGADRECYKVALKLNLNLYLQGEGEYGCTTGSQGFSFLTFRQDGKESEITSMSNGNVDCARLALSLNTSPAR